MIDFGTSKVPPQPPFILARSPYVSVKSKKSQWWRHNLIFQRSNSRFSTTKGELLSFSFPLNPHYIYYTVSWELEKRIHRKIVFKKVIRTDITWIFDAIIPDLAQPRASFCVSFSFHPKFSLYSLCTTQWAENFNVSLKEKSFLFSIPMIPVVIQTTGNLLSFVF